MDGLIPLEEGRGERPRHPFQSSDERTAVLPAKDYSPPGEGLQSFRQRTIIPSAKDRERVGEANGQTYPIPFEKLPSRGSFPGYFRRAHF